MEEQTANAIKGASCFFLHLISIIIIMSAVINIDKGEKILLWFILFVISVPTYIITLLVFDECMKNSI